MALIGRGIKPLPLHRNLPLMGPVRKTTIWRFSGILVSQDRLSWHWFYWPLTRPQGLKPQEWCLNPPIPWYDTATGRVRPCSILLGQLLTTEADWPAEETGWPLTIQCEIPWHFRDGSQHSSTVLGMLSVTHIMPVPCYCQWWGKECNGTWSEIFNQNRLLLNTCMDTKYTAYNKQF